jgi:NADPH2:quinone reductase
MHAILIAEPGGPEAMKWIQTPTPAPAKREVLVRVEAAGVNFIDIYFRKGVYKMPLPSVLGVEGAGTVEALGPEAAGFGLRVGDRVAWTDRTGAATVGGSYATHTVVPAARLVAVPPAIDARTAAASMLQGMTAHYLSHSTFALREGHACLVHAAAGGVGLLLCQMAKRAGARVIGTVSTEEKAALARAAGADDTILYTKQDFEAETRRITEGRGVHVVYDSVGKTTFEKSLASLAPRGMLVLYGQSSGPVAPFDPQVLNAKGSLFLTRPSLGHYVATRDELLARATEVLGSVESGKLRVRIGATFALRDAAEAHRALESRATTGKVLLVP